MDEELSSFNKSNANLDLAVNDLRLKLRAAEKQVQIEKTKVFYYNSIIKKFKADLNECAQYIQDPKPLKAKVKGLYQVYCKELGEAKPPESISEEALDAAELRRGKETKTNDTQAYADGNAEDMDMVVMESDAQEEHVRQRMYLERTIANLRKAVTKDQLKHKADHVKIMQENVSLIREINQLRKDIQARLAKRNAAMAAAAVAAVTSSPIKPQTSETKVPSRLPAI
jgi:hypothetical protein